MDQHLILLEDQLPAANWSSTPPGPPQGAYTHRHLPPHHEDGGGVQQQKSHPQDWPAAN